jgi:2-polyprenyl-3-methyl-5-hydroxy-6-metoxy-1,4-benzoquinol methylase
LDSAAYKKTWVQPSGLDALNRRIHDGVPVEHLAERAAERRDLCFEELFPYARPAEGAKVLELGPGVGWIMEAMLERYPIAEIVGLDVSEVMIEAAQQRWTDPRASYVAYDGLRVPLADDTFDNVYSIACLQHIEKHHAFLVMQELVRLLKPGGHGTLHLMSIHHLPITRASFEQECWKHVWNANTHWMHYYSYDEIVVLFSYALGVTDLDVKFWGTSFWVHFSKGTDRPFHDKDVNRETFLQRGVPESIRPRAGRLPLER